MQKFLIDEHVFIRVSVDARDRILIAYPQVHRVGGRTKRFRSEWEIAVNHTSARSVDTTQARKLLAEIIVLVRQVKDGPIYLIHWII